MTDRDQPNECRAIAEIWSLSALRIVAGPLELRPVVDHEIPALVSIAAAGKHTPETMPFAFPGVQGFSTESYLVTRTGGTGSWLGLVHQGQGIGTLMRQTLCALVFDHLDAEEVTSAAVSPALSGPGLRHLEARREV